MKKSLKLLITSIITILMVVSSIPITAFAAESIATAKVTIKYSAYTYTGNTITPDNINGRDDITVTLNGKTLTKKTDYTVSYTNNTKVGKEATITIKGIKKYDGIVTKTFIIKPAKNKVVSYYTTNTGHFTLNWEKGTNGTVGYQILYSQDKELLKSATGEMKNADETKYVHSYTTTNLTANFTSKTQANKTYYVKVRSFYTKDGTTTSTRYGNYSDVVEIHTTNNKTFTRGIGGATAWVAAPGDATKTVEINGKMYKNGTRLKMLYLDNTGVYVEIISDGNIGHINFTNIFVNLADLEPNIIGNITNAESSIYKIGNNNSNLINVPNLTGVKLYNWGNGNKNKVNAIDGTKIIALNYNTAIKVAKAQHIAQNQGYNLKVYDAYRPYSKSKYANNILNNLPQNYKNNYIANGVYNLSWFIANTNVKNADGSYRASAHNVGNAIDVTLVYASTNKECNMPTNMHVLSYIAAKYTTPYSGIFTNTMTLSAKTLHNICTEAGLTSLASEWWHFQDNQSGVPNNSYYSRDFDLQ